MVVGCILCEAEGNEVPFEVPPLPCQDYVICVEEEGESRMDLEWNKCSTDNSMSLSFTWGVFSFGGFMVPCLTIIIYNKLSGAVFWFETRKPLFLFEVYNEGELRV